MDDQSIKKNIAGLRKKSGLTQTELADRIGISRTAYRNLESGSTRMLNENIDKVAEVLDRPVEEIVLGYSPPPPPPHKAEDEHLRNYGKKGLMLENVETMAGLKEQNAYLREQFSLLREQYATLKEQNEIMKELVDSLKQVISGRDKLLAQISKEKDSE